MAKDLPPTFASCEMQPARRSPLWDLPPTFASCGMWWLYLLLWDLSNFAPTFHSSSAAPALNPLGCPPQ